MAERSTGSAAAESGLQDESSTAGASFEATEEIPLALATSHAVAGPKAEKTSSESIVTLQRMTAVARYAASAGPGHRSSQSRTGEGGSESARDNEIEPKVRAVLLKSIPGDKSRANGSGDALCEGVPEVEGVEVPDIVGVMVADLECKGESACDGVAVCVSDADEEADSDWLAVSVRLCVRDGVEEPEGLAVSVGLCVPLGVAPADAESVAVPVEEDMAVMTTRRRRLLL